MAYNNYKQGKFEPTNKKKYKGNWQKITYRSGWELQYFKMCDIIKKAVTDYKLSNFNVNSLYAKKVCNDYDTYLDESAELGLHPISIKDYIIKYA